MFWKVSVKKLVALDLNDNAEIRDNNFNLFIEKRLRDIRTIKEQAH